MSFFFKNFQKKARKKKNKTFTDQGSGSVSFFSTVRPDSSCHRLEYLIHEYSEKWQRTKKGVPFVTSLSPNRSILLTFLFRVYLRFSDTKGELPITGAKRKQITTTSAFASLFDHRHHPHNDDKTLDNRMAIVTCFWSVEIRY